MPAPVVCGPPHQCFPALYHPMPIHRAFLWTGGAGGRGQRHRRSRLRAVPPLSSDGKGAERVAVCRLFQLCAAPRQRQRQARARWHPARQAASERACRTRARSVPSFSSAFRHRGRPVAGRSPPHQPSWPDPDGHDRRQLCTPSSSACARHAAPAAPWSPHGSTGGSGGARRAGSRCTGARR